MMGGSRRKRKAEEASVCSTEVGQGGLPFHADTPKVA